MLNRWKRKKKELKYIVACIESHVVELSIAVYSQKSQIAKCEIKKKFDPSDYLVTNEGERLIEHIALECKKLKVDLEDNLEGIILSLPGAVGSKSIKRASRLKIFQEMDVSVIFKKNGFDNIFLTRDVDCFALGEFVEENGTVNKQFKDVNFIYIYSDEGVGSSTYLNGNVYQGAGFAGPIGRLTVEPDGTFNEAFKSHGSLEAFVGRPFISQNIINHFKSEFGKQNEKLSKDELTYRKRLKVASDSPSELDFSDFLIGEELQDPNTILVLNKAYKYMGQALNAIVTIMNPPLLILGGRFFTELPNSFTETLNYTRRYSWENAWNSCKFKVAKAGKDGQHLGALLQVLVKERRF